ncbi:MAG TPA: PKD domain-containing protein [Kofleriaceae bacterium]
MAGCGWYDNEASRTGAIADPCADGSCCVNPATCIVTDEQTLAGLTVDATISCPFRIGSWVSGGLPTGVAPANFPANQCGLSASITGETQASAIDKLDHHWLQTSSGPIVIDMGTPANTAFVFSIVDHRPLLEEGIESTVWGSNSPSTARFPAGWTLGLLTTIWKRGWEDPAACQGQANVDDFTGEYSFPGPGFRYIAVYASGSMSIFEDPGHTTWASFDDDFSKPGWQSHDNEIDAVGTAVCEAGAVVADAGPDQTSAGSSQICFDGSGSSAAGGIATLSWDLDGDGAIDATGPTACIPCTADGQGDVRLFVTDQCGCGASDTAHWTCVTNRPPDCSGAGPSVAELWPPNHEFRDISITGVTDPDGDPVTLTVTGVRQDEPVNALGDGNTCPDGRGVGGSTASVRVERTGDPNVPGDGRVYHIAFTASDGRGGTCTGEVTTCVPHDQRPGHACVDEGALFDSTVCGAGGGLEQRF